MKIEWAEPAILDLDSVRNYIARDSKHYAERFMEKLIEGVEKLKKFPKIGRRVQESEEKNIRELLFYNYRIIYRVETGRILILTVIHASRDLGQKEFKPWDII
jgi:addiction module RelE/StbE family toxin